MRNLASSRVLGVSWVIMSRVIRTLNKVIARVVPLRSLLRTMRPLSPKTCLSRVSKSRPRCYEEEHSQNSHHVTATWRLFLFLLCAA